MTETANPDAGATPAERERIAADMNEHARARTLLEQGDVPAAFDMLSRLASAATPCWQVYSDLAAIALTQEDIGAACELLEFSQNLADAPASLTLRRATLLAVVGQSGQALAELGQMIRTHRAEGEALALVRELLANASEISPVAWARLVADLRAPSAEQSARDAEWQAARTSITALTTENRRLAAQIDELRRELRLPRSAHWSSRDSDTWARVHALDDRAWLNTLLRSVSLPSIDGFPLAGFPPEQLQVNMVGSSNEGALREGFEFYRAVRDACRKHGQVWDGEGQLLDFGTGWGRYARIFMKDFRPENVVGIDVDKAFIRICRETFPYGRFETVAPVPPSGLDDESFDLIIAYSVFSHLAEHAASAWITEFTGLLKPGGMIAITTQGRSFLEVCERYRNTREFTNPWHEKLAKAFSDRAACELAYENGQFLFSPTGGGEVRPSDFYGEAIVSPGFVRNNWCSELELCEFIDDRKLLPQALIVLRKQA